MDMPFEFCDFLFLRSPARSSEDFYTMAISKILADELFRKAIYFSSPPLYQQLLRSDFDFQQLNPGIRDKVWKYYNRMCFRSTPFGMLSAFSSISWSGSQNLMKFTGKEVMHLCIDHELSISLANFPPGKVYSNPALYELGSEWRCVVGGRHANSQPGIASVAKTKLISEVIALCRDGLDISEVRSLLARKISDSEGFISELLDEEILLSDSQPNISGEHYLQRVSKLFKSSMASALCEKVNALTWAGKFSIAQLEHLLQPFTGISGKLQSPYYVNYEKEVAGGVCEIYQADLLQGLSILNRLNPSREPAALLRFKEQFLLRFEQEEIPLLLALDPDVGIGYESLEANPHDGEILADLNFQIPTEPVVNLGALQTLLINKMSCRERTDTLVLQDDDLTDFRDSVGPMSPGISVLFRICQKRVIIEAAGGATGISLIGRFTPFSDSVFQDARSMAAEEQARNPQVIFAEVSFAPKGHVANVNVRQHIREYEIPVLVHSTLDHEHVIALNDLMVSVVNNELTLRSKRLDKRIVPRSSTAYNYTLSEVPVFRFLSDLQYQGIQSNFSLNLEQILPGLTYYPRVEYRNCILFSATWILNEKQINLILTEDDWLGFSKRFKIPRYFAIVDSDKQLIFDIDDRLSMEALLKHIRTERSVKIREFLTDKQDSGLLTDTSGKPYQHQLIAFLLNRNTVYKSFFTRPNNDLHTDRYVFPGNEWVYFKIYCSEHYSNEILTRKIYPLIVEHKALIWKWFFVRYYDQGQHLRIRIFGDPGFVQGLSKLLNVQLKKEVQARLVHTIQVDTYVREIERYGTQSMEHAENVFAASSNLVLEFLKYGVEEAQLFRFALCSCDRILNSFSMTLDARILLLERTTKTLMSENGTEKQLRGQLNQKFRVHQILVRNSIEHPDQFFKRHVFRNFSVLDEEIKRFAAITNQTNNVPDILHMHMNRIFNSKQRKKELVIYYMCLRHYISAKARSMPG